MAFGFAKDFVIFIFIAVIVGMITENWQTGIGVLLIYIPIKVVWRVLT